MPSSVFFFSIALIILKNQSHKSFYIYHILHALHLLYGLCLGGFERVLQAPCWERLPEQLPSVRRNPINIHQPQGRCGKKKVDPHWSETANFPFFFVLVVNEFCYCCFGKAKQQMADSESAAKCSRAERRVNANLCRRWQAANPSRWNVHSTSRMSSVALSQPRNGVLTCKK